MKKKYQVGGMSCAACSLGIEKRVSAIEGVESVTVSLLEKSMTVTFSDPALEGAILSAVTDLGYEVRPDGERGAGASDAEKLKRRFFFSLIFLIPLLWFSMGGMIGLPQPQALISYVIQWVLSLAVIVVNRRFFSSGVRALVKGVPNMDTLVAIASTVAFTYSVVVTAITIFGGSGTVFFEASAMVLTLVTLGKLLEEKSKSRTGREVEALVRMIPTTVRVRREGEERVIPREEVAVGETVILRQGDRVPVDGVVLEGSGFLDTSVITGEPLPKEVLSGDQAISGSIVSSGMLVIRAEKVGEDAAFSRVVQMVRDAAASKAPVQRVADKIAGIFVPVVTAIAAVTFLVWMLVTKDVARAFRYAVSVLVISCPCALGLATPVAVMAAAGKGASLGVLYKNAESIETLSRVNCLLIDKTATLTEGKPVVKEFINLTDIPDEEILSLARATEESSLHPLAECIKAYCGETALKPDEVQYVPGEGGVAVIDGEHYYIGNSQLIPFVVDFNYETEHAGATVVYFSSEELLLAVFVIEDEIKADAKETMEKIAAAGVHEVMLTGDGIPTALKVGAEVGIGHIHAGMMPEMKASLAEDYKEQGYVTAMTGDGINDAPALKKADVGIAMGTGTDVAIDSADVVLRSGEIGALADAIFLAKKTFRIIKSNLFWAFFYNLIAIPIAAGVFAFWGLSLTPTISAAAMSLSSLFVVLNALRINGYKRTTLSAVSEKPVEAIPPEETLPDKGLDRECSTENKEVCDMCFKAEKTTVLSVEGMMCEHCRSRVEKALSAVSGVKKVVVDLVAKTATVTGTADLLDLKEAVIAAGYKAETKE